MHKSITITEEAVTHVNAGTCEGSELNSDQLAGQYAYEIAMDTLKNGDIEEIDVATLEGHLEFLATSGASFDEAAAVEHGMALAKAQGTGRQSAERGLL